MNLFLRKGIEMKKQRNSYPLRLDEDVRAQAERVAAENERSLNWLLNSLVKTGLANIAGQKESASTAGTVKR